MSNCCPEATGLARYGDNPIVVVVAYLAAFFPWAVLHALDFISPRWHPIQSTRRAGYFHLASSIPPLGYIIFYTHVQRLAGDFKEMSAAIAAIMLCLLHIVRTLWGLVQLQAFKDWCARAIMCIERMGCHQLEKEDSADDYCTLARDCVDQDMRVNETLVDNEYTETDLPVAIQVPKKGLLLGINDLLRGRTEDWLYCRAPVECNVRWLASFLCQFGLDWVTECKMRNMETFSAPAAEVIQIQALLQVTAFIPRSKGLEGEDDCDKLELQSFLQPLHHFLFLQPRNIQNHVFPYGNVLEKGNIYRLSNQRFNLHDALSSYDPRALDDMNLRDENVISEITLTNLQSFMALLDEQREEWSEYKAHVEKSALWSNLRNDSIPVLVFFAQLGYPEGTNLGNILNGIPIPKKMCSSLLWSVKTNRCLLQASVHVDNLVALEAGRLFKDIDPPQLPLDSKSHYIFHIYEKMEFERDQNGQSETEEKLGDLDSNSRARHFGCIMETVRSLLANWLMSTARNGIGVDWQPILSQKKFEFRCSDQLLECLYNFQLDQHSNSSVSARILWECQYNLQTVVASGNHDPELPRSVELIMLFVLGFPSLQVVKDETAYAPTMSFTISPVLGPQDIEISMECNPNISRVTLCLVSTSNECFFHWEKWKNAAKGRISGQYKRLKETVARPHKLVRMPDVRWTKISRPLVHVEVPNRDIVELQKSLWYWIGWPPAYPRIASFETDQLVPEDSISSVEMTDLTTNIEMGATHELFKQEIIQIEKGLNEIGSVFDDLRKASGNLYTLFRSLEMAERSKEQGTNLT